MIIIALSLLEERRLRPAGTLLGFPGILSLHCTIILSLLMFKSTNCVLTVFSPILRRVSDVGRDARVHVTVAGLGISPTYSYATNLRAAALHRRIKTH